MFEKPQAVYMISVFNGVARFAEQDAKSHLIGNLHAGKAYPEYYPQNDVDVDNLITDLYDKTVIRL